MSAGVNSRSGHALEHDATLASLKVHDELLVHVLAVHGCECGLEILGMHLISNQNASTQQEPPK